MLCNLFYEYHTRSQGQLMFTHQKRQQSMYDIKKLAINRAETQLSSWPCLLSDLKLPLTSLQVTQGTPTCSAPQFQGAREAQDEPRGVGSRLAHGGFMLGILTGRMKGAKVT